jgi:hypothetical protein
MTVLEAAGLIIQAGAMGKGGEIFVLDMGEPVRIDDVARKMIRLAGLTVKHPDNPGGDIAIEYSGLRPGEKLHEELVIGDCVKPTLIPKIMCAMEDRLSAEQVHAVLRLLKELCDQHDCEGLRKLFLRVVDGYAPSGALVDPLWDRSSESLLRARSKRSSDLTSGIWSMDQLNGEQPTDRLTREVESFPPKSERPPGVRQSAAVRGR